MDAAIEKLQQYVDECDNIVFFGGAGVSTESGIPDFRSVDGLYHQQYDYPPETILSHTFFMHQKLAALEKAGKLRAVITQNIDNLHQMAGSQNVLELHGSVYRNHCMNCKKSYNFAYMKAADGIPHCSCGGIIKPDVVLYEEGLDSHILDASVSAISHAQLLIIGGTSLAVYPAAGLIDYFQGKYLVVINKSPTPRDKHADLLISSPIGEAFAQIQVRGL